MEQTYNGPEEQTNKGIPQEVVNLPDVTRAGSTASTENMDYHFKYKWDFIDMDLYSRNLSVEDQQWISGFWEGDGSISPHLGTFYITFSQKDRQIIDHLAEILEYPAKPFNPGVSEWRLSLGKKVVTLPLLKVLVSNLNSRSRLIRIKALVENLKIPIEVQEGTISDPWLAGFWDAEGNSYTPGGTLKVSFPQKEEYILGKMQTYVGPGKLTNYGFPELGWFGPSVKDIVPPLLRYSQNVKKKNTLITNIIILSQEVKEWNGYYGSLREEGLL